MSAGSKAGGGGGFTVGDVVRAALPHYTANHRLPVHHAKVLRAIAACHTPALGGHLYTCTACGYDHFVPHSCRNRHCPTCQGINGAQWLEKQIQDLLPIPYFHLVFTLPHELNPLVAHNQRALYNLLFASVSDTLLQFGRQHLRAEIGITAVLHTWGQTLTDHYHLHCLVTGGGAALDGSAWVPQAPHYLFPVRALSVVFRAKFRAGLQALFAARQLQFPAAAAHLSQPAGFIQWLRRCCRHQWVVYAKRPFAGPQTVLAYLCRYTHRVGLTNRRIEALDPVHQTVTFGYKDYAQASRPRSMTLSLDEFLRRFCLHILPPRFVKIRYYGLLTNRGRSVRLAQARELLAQVVPAPLMTATAHLTVKQVESPTLVCPRCGRPTLVLVFRIAPIRPTLPPVDTS
jgi:hypothetical protein